MHTGLALTPWVNVGPSKGTVRSGVDWGWFPGPRRIVRCGWEPSARHLLIFEEHSANKTMPADTGKIVVDSLTYADDANGEPYFHDQIVFLAADYSFNFFIW